MKVGLIEPPHPYLVQQRTQPPIGLLYVASSLRNGHDGVCHEPVLSRLWDMSEEELEGIPEADVYGISATSLDYAAAVEIARYLKKTRHATVILGGFHATVCGDEEGVFDAICRGEGEIEIFNILRDFQAGKLKTEYRAERIENLDLLAPPSRDLIDYQGGNIFSFNKNYFKNGSTVIVGSRGCPYRCAFCGSVSLWARRYACRTAQSIRDEVCAVMEEFNIRQFRFSDEVFTLRESYTEELCNLLKPLNIVWKCSTRVQLLTEKLLQKMYESGCREIAVGAESGDPAVLTALKKDQTPEEIYQCCSRIAESGISVRILLMINTPGENLTTVDENIELLERTPHKMASLAVFKPLPGCEIWNHPERFMVNILTRDLALYNLQLFRKNTAFDILFEPPVISINGLNFEQMYQNRRRMVEYLEAKQSINRG